MIPVLIVSAILLLALLLLIVSNFVLNAVAHPNRHTEEEMRRRDLDAGLKEALDDYDRLWHRTTFTVDCGDAALSGEYVVNPADTRPRKRVAVICHGQTANRISALKYAKLLYDAGYSIVIFDERYFGRSGGTFSTLGQRESADLARLLSFVRTVFGEDCVIGLHGESMGAATALGVLRYERPAFVIADCPFSVSRELYRHILRFNYHLPPFPFIPLADLLGNLRYGFRLTAFDPLDAVSASDVPVCLMHGKEDTLIPASHSEQLFRASRNPASELHLFDGANHAESMYRNPQLYGDLVRAFIKKIDAGDI